MHAAIIFNHKDLNLAYVYDKNFNLALKSKNKYKNRVIKDYKIALKDKKTDIIFISSPTSTHLRFIEESVSIILIIFLKSFILCCPSASIVITFLNLFRYAYLNPRLIE